MNTEKKLSLRSLDFGATRSLGLKLGSNLKGGEVIELVGDLGAGKTAITKAIVAGAGIADTVSSPTFTVENIYTGDDLTVHHYDFYRLEESGTVGLGLYELSSSPGAVVIVEWGGVAQGVLPEDRVIMKITTVDEDLRNIDINVTESQEYLIEGLDK